MLACDTCGKPNPGGSLFCRSCGRKLAEAPPAAPVAAIEAPTCPRCNTLNSAGMNFCRMCGTPLGDAQLGDAGADTMRADGPAHRGDAPARAVGPSQAASAAKTVDTPRITCFSCNRATPAGFTFCQHCGTRLATTGAAVPPKTTESRPAAAVPVERRAAAVSPAAPIALPREEARPAPLPARGRLVVLKPDGSEAEAHPIVVGDGGSFDVGRADGNLIFATDALLAPRHARFSFAAGVVRVRALDTTNGVYLRVREPWELTSGDQLLVGRELLRFETLAAEERDPPQLVEHGVRLLGSFSREAWGRLRQVNASGVTRNMWYLVRPESMIGRNEGDVTFPDDDQVSPRHAVVKRVGARIRIEEVPGSGAVSGGTFVRLRAERDLRHGDVLRLGDQFLRFESQTS